MEYSEQALQEIEVQNVNDRLMIVELKKQDNTIIQQENVQKHSVLFIHGMAESGQYYLEKIQRGEFRLLDNVRYLIPSGTVQYVSRINKEVMAWYDIKALDPEDPDRYNMEQMDETIQYLNDILTEEAKSQYDGDYSRIFVSGFSQGGCLTYVLGLLTKNQYAGLIPMGSICIPQFFTRLQEQSTDTDSQDSQTNEKLYHLELKSKTLPILHYHGGQDPLFLVDRMKANLQRAIVDRNWKQFEIVVDNELGHDTNKGAFDKLSEFALKVIKEKESKDLEQNDQSKL
eukprot:403353094